MNPSEQTLAIEDVDNNGKPIQGFYDPFQKVYWVPNSRDEWIEINEANFRRRLRQAGLWNKADKGEPLSEVEAKLIETQERQDIAYAGSLAGYGSGLIESNGKRILITDSPKLITPVKGDWPTLDALLQGLLVDEDFDQRQYLYGWIKVFCEALRAHRFRPGQLMGLCGPRDCGKSLVQKLLTILYGGRAAKPYRYMKGGTEFNAELFGAEHLVIEDEHCSTNIAARRQFGAQIKQFTVNQDQSCHDKGRRAITLAPFWRMSLSVNDEPESMMVLPPMGDSDQDSLSDKVFLLRAKKTKMPMPTTNLREYGEFWNKLVSELPGFLHFLAQWEIPAELQCGRFGIKTWHHPKLLASLDALAPETRLLSLIDQVLFFESDLPDLVVRTGRTEWVGTAEELEKKLCESTFCHEARKLLNWGTATGTYLGRLEKKGQRVEKDRSADLRKWRILAPGQPMNSLKAA